MLDTTVLESDSTTQSITYRIAINLENSCITGIQGKRCCCELDRGSCCKQDECNIK